MFSKGCQLTEQSISVLASLYSLECRLTGFMSGVTFVDVMEQMHGKLLFVPLPTDHVHCAEQGTAVYSSACNKVCVKKLTIPTSKAETRNPVDLGVSGGAYDR